MHALRDVYDGMVCRNGTCLGGVNRRLDRGAVVGCAVTLRSEPSHVEAPVRLRYVLRVRELAHTGMGTPRACS